MDKCEPNCTCEVCFHRRLNAHRELIASVEPHPFAQARTPSERDLDIHVPALGEWCDCCTCLRSREAERASQSDERSGASLTVAESLVLREHDAYREQLRSGPSAPYLGEFGGQVTGQDGEAWEPNSPRALLSRKGWAVFWTCWVLAFAALALAVRS